MSDVITIELGGIESFEETIGVLAQTGARKTGHRTFTVPLADLTPAAVAALQLLDIDGEDIRIAGMDYIPEEQLAVAAQVERDVLDAADLVDAGDWWAEHHG